jgi:reactive intermediate/imine deaminase
MTQDTDGKIIYPSSGGYPYSEAIRAGDFVYVSGVIATNPDGSVSTGPIEVQTAMVLDQLKAILAKAGCTLADVINCGCSLQDARDFSGFNKVYARYFPTAPPTRTTLVVTHVLDARVEIDCIAYNPSPGGGAVDFAYNALTREDLRYEKSQYPVEGTFTGVTPPWLNDLSRVPADWRPTTEDNVASAARLQQIEAELAYITANVPQQRYTGATTEQLIEERYTLGMWSPEVFAKGQIEALTRNWIKSDAEFARQRLGGANPNVIKRADAGGDDVSGWIAGACNGGELGSLAKRLTVLQQQGQLFVCDYRALLGPVIDNGFVMNGRHFAAPVCFFSIDADGDTLTPEAIQIVGNRAESYIFTPDDPADTNGDAWLLAKLWVASADQQWWFSGAHLFNAHTIDMLFGIAALNQIASGALSGDHPMLVLAKPFLVKVFDINSQIISAPAAQEGGIYQKGANPFCDQVLPTGRVGVYQIISGLYKDYRFEDNAFPAQMSRRGLEGEAIDKVAFPYRDDGRIWWGAIKAFVGEIVRATYADDAAVASDKALAAWMGKVKAAFNHDGASRFSYLPTRAGIEAVFTNLLFLCSVQHTAVNNTMFPSWAFTPNGAFAMQAAPPRDAASVTQAMVLASLPDPQGGALGEIIAKQIYFVMNATPIVPGTLGVDPRSADRMHAVYPYAPGSAQAAAVGRFWSTIWTGESSVAARIKQNQEARVRSWRGATPVPNSLSYDYLSPGLVAFAPPAYLNAPVMNAIQV